MSVCDVWACGGEEIGEAIHCCAHVGLWTPTFGPHVMKGPFASPVYGEWVKPAGCFETSGWDNDVGMYVGIIGRCVTLLKLA